MIRLRELWARLPFASGVAPELLDEEIVHHLEHLAAAHAARGLSAEEARLAALRDFGGLTRTREHYREQRGFRWLDELRQDVRYASRSMRRNPGFTIVAVLTLALGIGAATAIFSVVDGVLLEPLPFPGGERLVHLRVTLQSREGPPDERPLTLSAADVTEVAQRTRSFAQVGAITVSLASWPGHEPRWSGGVVTASIFPMLGVRPVLGRVLLPQDEIEGAPGAMVLSYRAWQRHFGGRPEALGRSITLEPALTLGVGANPEVYTVVGVMPEGFQFLPGQETPYWIPMRSSGRGRVVARLAPETHAAAALGEAEPVLRSLAARQVGARVLSYGLSDLQRQLVAPVRTALLVLMGAVACVLLIACVNVANLLLARSVGRQREMAIRASLGAGRARIARLMVTESMLLSAIASLGGIGLAHGGVRLLRWLATTADRIDLGLGGAAMIPRLDAVAVDGRVLLFAIATSATIAFGFGLLPALQHRRMAPSATLRNGSGATLIDSAGPGGIGLRGLLVVAEVALSIVLLVGGVLLMTTFIKLQRVDAGYDADRVLTFQVSLPASRYPLPRLRAFAEDFTTRLQAIPGVTAAAYANQLPLVQLQDTLPLGRTPDPQRQPGRGGDVRVVGRTYFTTMRIPVRAGRVFGERDGSGAPQVLVINEALANRDFGSSAAAVGQLLYIARNTTPWTIVGVVGNVRQFGLAQAPEPQFFLDARQWGEGLSPLFPIGAYYALRIDGDDGTAIAAVESAMKQLDAESVLFNVTPMNDIIADSLARPRMYAVLLALFAAIGMVLALIGTYGVTNYTVLQRTRELGIRLALGAQRGAVLRLVLRHSLALTIGGITVGLLGAVGLTRYLATFLYEMTPLDPLTFAATAVLFGSSALLAAFVPARRATKVDPLTALRAE